MTQLQALLKCSTSGVREIVDGVVDGKPGGLSQVSNATYDILERATGSALSFVATQLGLGSVPGKLTDIFKKLDLRSYVYVAAYKLAEKAKSFAGFGQLLPAPLSAKIPLADGQKLWEMKGKDGKAELVIDDPRKVNKTNAAVQAADNLGNQEIEDLDKLDAAIKALAKKKPLTDEDRQQLIKLAEELTEKVKSLRNADTAVVKVAAVSVQTSAQKTGYAAWEEVLGNRVTREAAKDKYFRVRRILPEGQWVAAYAEYLQTKIPNMSVEDLNAVAARVAAPEPSSKGGSGKLANYIGTAGEAISIAKYGPKNSETWDVPGWSTGAKPDHVLKKNPVTGRPIVVVETKNQQEYYLVSVGNWPLFQSATLS